MAFGQLTYDDTARREDLLDLITDVSPDSNPISTMLDVVEAKQTTHQWLEDYQGRPTSNSGEVEGSDATFADLTQPSRRTNVTQIIRKTFKVSDTEEAVNVAGMSSPFDYQRDKGMRDWKNRLEFALVRSTLGSGASGTAQTMSGIQATVTSHYTALLSGSSLREADINWMQYAVVNDVGDDDVFDSIFTTLQLRQKISTFTAGNTRYIDASDMKLVRKVMVYEGDFGPMKIFGHRDVTSAVATPGPRLLGLNMKKWKVAYLTGRKPKYTPLAKTGSNTKGMIEGEATLEFLAERANAQMTGFASQG